MITLYENDVVKLKLTIEKNSEPLDLTGASVYLYVRDPGGSLITTLSGTIINATAGQVEFTIDSTVTGSPGFYIYEIEVETAASKYTALKDTLQIKSAAKTA